MRFSWLFIFAVLLCLIASGCSKSDNEKPKTKEEKVLTGVANVMKSGTDTSANAAGRVAAFAQETYRAENGTYTGNLGELSSMDKNILTDPEVTFNFQAADADTYTFTTTHAKGSGKVYTFTK